MYNSRLIWTTRTISDLFSQAEELASSLRTYLRYNKTNLIIAQNTNSLPYNLVAAIALILASAAEKIPVLHQAFDFYWQHDGQTRKRFANVRFDPKAYEFLGIIAGWHSPLWRFAMPNNSFRQIAVEKGMDPLKTFTVCTPVVKPQGFDTPKIAEHLARIKPGTRSGPLGGPSSLKFGKTPKPNETLFTVLIPSKLSDGKNVPLTVRTVVELLEKLGASYAVRIVVSGTVYDMATAADVLRLHSSFAELFTFLQSKSTEVGWRLELTFLGGTPRFESKGTVTMDELFHAADLVVFGSHLETDCIGLYEAVLAQKPVWLRPWTGEYRNVFDEIVQGLVVGILSDSPSTVFDPSDELGMRMITKHNKMVLSRRRLEHTFRRQISEAIGPSRERDDQKIAARVTDLLESRLGPSTGPPARIICLGGPAGSGKSTLVDAIVNECRGRGRHCMRISLDDYVHETLPTQEYGPHHIRLSELIEDIRTLTQGDAKVLPRYYHRVKTRGVILGYSNSWIFVEGVYALSREECGFGGISYRELRNISSLDIWLETRADLAQQRCLLSDSLRNANPEWMVTRFNQRRKQWFQIHRDRQLSDVVLEITDSTNVLWKETS